MTRKKTIYRRDDERAVDELRPVTFKRDFAPSAKGSVLIEMGRTHVICGVTVEESVPRWKRAQKVSGGWVTAEYSMLPYASNERTRRESTSGKVGGRTQEIQRLIGRSLRAVIDMDLLGPRTLWVDCDVLQADGGTRTAAITGGFAAVRLAVDRLMKEGLLENDPIKEGLAAVSVGVVRGEPLLDLCYTEDLAAEVDMNIVMTSTGKFVEVQGTAEESPFSQASLTRMLTLGKKGILELLEKQESLRS
ncbi:MAG: ribonuclease PH [Verrucomicrobia bacterium]|nr:ribonuclease PH [Verrucomicrobiota bacterium]